MKKKRMLWSLIIAGGICTVSSINATSFSVNKIQATSGSYNKVVSKSTSDRYWTANFEADGKTNTIILYMYNKPNTSNSSIVGNNIIASEGGGLVRQSAWGSKGESLKIVWRDFNGNWASYTCKGTVDVR